MKLCVRCEQSKSPTEFHHHKKTLDSLDSWCKSCHLEYKREWRRNNPGREKRPSPEASRRYSRKYYATPRGKAAAIANAIRNRHRRAAAIARWEKRNPQKGRERWQRRQARIRNAYVASVDRDAIYERDAWVCQICHRLVDPEATALKDRPSIDHIIPLAMGGTHEPKNVQLAHFGCNSAKGKRTLPQVV